MAAYRRVDGLVTCGLTACTPGSAPDPTLGNEYGKPLLFYYLITVFSYYFIFIFYVLTVLNVVST